MRTGLLNVEEPCAHTIPSGGVVVKTRVKMVGQSPFEEDVRAGFFLPPAGVFFGAPPRFFKNLSIA